MRKSFISEVTLVLLLNTLIFGFLSRPLLAQDEGRPLSGSSDLSALVARQQLRMDTLESSLKDIRGTIELEFRDIRVQLEQLAASALAEQSETSVDVKQFQSEMTRFGDAIEILNQRISRTLELTSDVEFRVLRLEKRMQTLMSLSGNDLTEQLAQQDVTAAEQPPAVSIGRDANTGETVWQVDSLTDEAERALSGPENDGNANEFQSDKDRRDRLRGSWNTPILTQVDGRHELVVALPRRISAFAPESGKLLWTCGGGAPLAYASVVEHEGVIVALGGYNGASMAIRGGGSGDVTETHRLWHKSRDNGWLGTGVAEDGSVYVCDMGGVLHCLEVSSGEIQWKSRVEGGGTWSSITQTSDGLMHLLTKSGSTTVFRPNPEQFDEVAVNELNETTNASVVIAGGEVFIRTDDALWCFAK